MTEFIGYLAAIFTTLSFLPQALRILRTRETGAISLSMYLLFTGGVLAWLIYGLLLGAWPIIIANAITLCLAGLILSLKLSDVIRSSRSS
jgi:MtN3 and saliva related transmembrane protein